MPNLRCPNSVFGTNLPSIKTAEPIPVPKVRKITVPFSPLPFPNFISATPATSASLAITNLHLVCFEKTLLTLVPIQLLSILAADILTPFLIMAGKPAPTIPFLTPARSTISLTANATDSGVAGLGVRIRILECVNLPVSKLTTAPLMPVPPTSIPSTFFAIVYF